VSKVACVLQLGLALRDQEEWSFEGSYVGVISCALAEIWSFSLIYTVYHFRFTEESVDLFFKTSINEDGPLLASDSDSDNPS